MGRRLLFLHGAACWRLICSAWSQTNTKDSFITLILFPLIFLWSQHCDTADLRLVFPADIPYIQLQSYILMLNVDMIHHVIPFETYALILCHIMPSGSKHGFPGVPNCFQVGVTGRGVERGGISMVLICGRKDAKPFLELGCFISYLQVLCWTIDDNFKQYTYHPQSKG